MPELKPCPFCGEEAFVCENPYYLEHLKISLYAVECNGCHATTFEYGSADEASKAWDRRTEDEKPL